MTVGELRAVLERLPQEHQVCIIVADKYDDELAVRLEAEGVTTQTEKGDRFESEEPLPYVLLKDTW